MNGKVYEYDSTLFNANKDVLTNLDLLDKFIASYESVQNFFKSTTEYADARNTIPYLAGDIFINNPADKKISEFAIFEHYNKYFPDLNIFVANVDNAYVANFVEILENGKEYEWDSIKYSKDTTSHPGASAVIPTKLHYDFKGWATKPDAKPADIITDWSQFPFAGKDTYTFYAIYDRHPYKFTFHYEDGVEPYVKEVLYNDYVGIPAEIYPYKDASALSLTECYGFKYYTSAKDSDVEVDLSKLKAVKDQTFYAYFKPMSVYDNVISKDYICIKDGKIDRTGDGKEYQTILKGKITLPTNGATSMRIGLLQLASNVTHIFFEKSGNTLPEISNYAFNNLTKVEYIEIPSSVTSIGEQSFSVCSKVKYIGTPIDDASYDSTSRKVHLASNITSMSKDAFASCGTFNELVIGSSETDLWQVADETAIANNVGGGAKFNNLTVYRDPISQSFITVDWLTDKFGAANQIEIKPA